MQNSAKPKFDIDHAQDTIDASTTNWWWRFKNITLWWDHFSLLMGRKVSVTTQTM